MNVWAQGGVEEDTTGEHKTHEIDYGQRTVLSSTGLNRRTTAESEKEDQVYPNVGHKSCLSRKNLTGSLKEKVVSPLHALRGHKRIIDEQKGGGAGPI